LRLKKIHPGEDGKMARKRKETKGTRQGKFLVLFREAGDYSPADNGGEEQKKKKFFQSRKLLINVL